MRKYTVGFIVLFLLSCNAYADLASIRSSIRYKIQDSTATTNYTTWTDPELNKRINATQNFIAYATRCLYVNAYSTPIAGTREYSKPTNCIAIDRVSFINASSTTASNQYKKLKFVTMGGLDRDYPTWESNIAGQPLMYYQRGDKIGFDRPVSSLYVSTGAIKIDYFKYPADMTSDTDNPFDNATYLQVYSDVIVLGVVYKCKQDELKWSEATAIQGEFVSALNLLIDSINANTDAVVSHIVIGK